MSKFDLDNFQERPDWVDEDIFQAARRRVIATMQVHNYNKIMIMMTFQSRKIPFRVLFSTSTFLLCLAIQNTQD